LNDGILFFQKEKKMQSWMLSRRKFFSVTGLFGLTLLTRELEAAAAQIGKEDKMVYQAKDYNSLVGMQRFSETLLRNHFTLYQGYVTNTNKLLETLGQMLKEGKVGTPEYAEFKRRFGWEFNGMRLHEYYFENLGGKGDIQKERKLYQKLADSFGSYEAWEKDFKATGSMRGAP
jgi:Fe-Mn family superoxide dismutase